MVELKSHYPNYNLLKEQNEWDEHTKEIVLKRLGPFNKPKFLSPREVLLLKAIIIQFINDDREEILDYIVDHIDQQLVAGIGEGERAPNSPPFNKLIPKGLKALDNLSEKLHQTGFAELNFSKQKSILVSLSVDSPSPLPDWLEVPPKAFFNKLIENIISPYYSHPLVWSEVGFGGPAYPRGYYRIEHGLTDPWEAKRNE